MHVNSDVSKIIRLLNEKTVECVTLIQKRNDKKKV